MDGPPLRRIGQPLVWLETVDSTNTEAFRRFESGAQVDGLVLIADEQTQGRGRHGRSWVLRTGSLACSLLIVRRAHVPLPCYTMLGALGVLACLRGLGFPAQLKWPNDVLVHGRKISGILVESRSSATAAANAEAVVLGIGINVSVRAGELPQDLRRKATSIHIEGGTAQREEVLGQLLHSLDGGLLDLEAEAGPERISASFSARLGIVDTRLSFATHQEEGEGIGVGLLPDGTLEVRQEKGELRRIAGGHLQWLRLRPS